MDLKKRYSNLKRRRINPESTTFRLSEALRKSDENNPIAYILGAMQEVDLKSTNTLIEQAPRLFNQLETPLAENDLEVVMQLQGSVTNNTHIRYYSDVDLLTLISSKKFVTLAAPLIPKTPYLKGKEDLLKLRDLSVSILTEKFPAAKVDSSKPKAIRVSGGSLKGPVDVVPCNWVDTEKWQSSNNLIHRGIKIIDAFTGERIENYPFMHNELLRQKAASSSGNSNKLIRFLKTLIADSKEDGDKIEISSYDICGLVFNMPIPYLTVQRGSEITLLKNFILWARTLLLNENIASTLEVPNGTRKLFHVDGLCMPELEKLDNAVTNILKEAEGTLLFSPDYAIRNFYSSLQG